MSIAPFLGTPHVDDLDPATIGDLRQAGGVELLHAHQWLGARLPFLNDVPTKYAAQAGDADFAEIMQNRLDGLLVVGFHDQADIAVLGNEGAHPIKKGFAERYVQRSRHMARRELLGGTSVYDDSLLVEGLAQIVQLQLSGRRSTFL